LEAVLFDTITVSVFLKIATVHDGQRTAVEQYISGKIAVVSFVTVAELLFWGNAGNGGRESDTTLISVFARMES
jgi:hypothetical protein